MAEKKKLFICHASEDKADFVRPLAKSLQKEFDVWYDEYSLVMGMSLFQEINKGLTNCDYGIVVLSPAFFGKKWPQDELDGLYALESKDRKVILPIWKDIGESGIKKYSPILAMRKATNAKDGVKVVVQEIKRSVDYFELGKVSKEGLNRFRSILLKREEKRRSNEIVRSANGVGIAYEAARKAIAILLEDIKSISTNIGNKSVKIRDQVDDGYGCGVMVFVGLKYLQIGYFNESGNDTYEARLCMRIGESSRERPSLHHEEQYMIFIDKDNNPLWISEDNENAYSPDEMANHWLNKYSEFIEEG